MGKYLSENSSIAKIKGYYSRTKKSADIAATFTNSTAYDSSEELVKECDIICVATPDDSILKVWEQIKDFNLHKKIICHFSGSLSSDIFSGIEKTGAEKISIHPMYAFSDKFTSYKQLNTARLTIEGSTEAVKVIKELFGAELKHQIFELKASDKVKYHAAAAFASNYIVGIFDVALELLKNCGFTDKDAVSLLEPLITGNVKSVLQNGTKDALTGPVIRNDIGTVKKHIEALEEKDMIDIYKSVGKRLVDISKQKYSDRDYGELEDIFSKRQ